jgi:hypothetical protein
MKFIQFEKNCSITLNNKTFFFKKNFGFDVIKEDNDYYYINKNNNHNSKVLIPILKNYKLKKCGRCKNVKYGDKNCKNEVWKLAKQINGSDSSEYRLDSYNKTIRYSLYGKQCEGGWQIDHKIPQNKHGSDYIYNLQALTTHINESKGDTLVKKFRQCK